MIRDGVWSQSWSLMHGALSRLPGSARVWVILEAIRKTFSIVPDLPSWVQIETTNRCNFDCEMCPRNLHKLPDADMDRESFTFILSRLGLHPGSLITLFGLGEPLMNPDTFWMVREVKKYGWEVGFTTNGVLLNETRIGEILNSGLDYLRISIDDDGLGSAQERLHKAAPAVISHTADLIERRGTASSPEILWNVVASMDSAPNMESIIARGADIGIDGVNIINLVPRFSTLTPLPDDRRASLFESWHRSGTRRGIRVQSTYGDRFGLRKFFYGSRKECPQLLDYAYITIDGRVSPCCHLPRTLMGDLHDGTLAEIWRGPAFRRFRRIYRSTHTCSDCRLLLWK